MNSRFPILAVLLLCSSLAFSQRPGSQPNPVAVPTPGVSKPRGADLQVRVSWENERSIDDEIAHVQLLGPGGEPIKDVFNSHDGLFMFSSISPGTYRIKVDGPNIEEMTTDTFQIDAMERMHMERVHVRRKPGAGEQNAANAGGAPIISASELNVPPKAKKELDKGMDSYAKGDNKKAEDELHKAIEIYPKYARAWNNLGVMLMKDGDKQGAQDAFLKSIEVDDKFPPGYQNMARIYLKAKDYPKAGDYIAKAVACDPNDVDTLSLRANHELLTGQYDKALADAQRVHGMPHPRLPDIHLVAAEALLQKNQGAEAIKQYELYLKEDPDSRYAAQVKTAMAQIQAKLPEANIKVKNDTN